MDGLFDAILDSAVLLDKSGRITHWSMGACSLFGYTKKDAIGKSINLIYDKNYPFHKLIQESIHHQKKWQEETTFIRKNGIKGRCKSSLCPLPDHEYKSQVLLIHQNISHLKQHENELLVAYHHIDQAVHELLLNSNATNFIMVEMINAIAHLEKRLRESELRFHLLAKNTTDIISRHNPSGSYLYVSPACLTFLGYAPDELIGKNIYHFIHHDDLNKVKKAFNFRRRKDIQTNRLIIYRIKQKEGEYRWFESNIRLIIDDQNRILNEIQLASRDITDRVLDKKARLRGQQLAHVFRLSTMEEMASGIAHEISQPLAAIVNYTRGCIRFLDNKPQEVNQIRGIIEKTAIQAERAGEIVQRLKNFFCKGQLVKTNCKINNIIRETIGLMKDEISTSKTKIEMDLEKEISFLFVDKIQIQQVFSNLIQNAIEAMTENQIKDRKIHIESKVCNNQMQMTITDTGHGFTKDIIHKVFMPFFTTKANGRGMGLAICRSIIEAHGGQFSINPNTNNKSWIRFSLPL